MVTKKLLNTLKSYLKASLIIVLGLTISIAQGQDHSCMERCPLPQLDVENDIDFVDLDFTSILLPEVFPLEDGQDGEFYCINISYGIPQFIRDIPPEVTGEAVPIDVEVLSVTIDKAAFSLPPGLVVNCITDGMRDADCTPVAGGGEGCIRIGGFPTDPVDSFPILATFTMRIDPLPLFGGLVDPEPVNFAFEDIVIDTISVAPGTLPISLASFIADAQQNGNLLEWTTEAEIAAHGFEVERSIDGVNFDFIHFEMAQSEDGSDYSYLDRALVPGQETYYRLKMIDLDGTHEYSDIIQLTSKSLAEGIYPNPANKRIFLSALSDKNSVFTITNEVGLVLQSQRLDESYLISDGIDIAGLAPGIYILRLSNSNLSTTHRFVKR